MLTYRIPTNIGPYKSTYAKKFAIKAMRITKRELYSDRDISLESKIVRIV